MTWQGDIKNPAPAGATPCLNNIRAKAWFGDLSSSLDVWARAWSGDMSSSLDGRAWYGSCSLMIMTQPYDYDSDS
jgi:hypothetical protein